MLGGTAKSQCYRHEIPTLEGAVVYKFGSQFPSTHTNTKLCFALYFQIYYTCHPTYITPFQNAPRIQIVMTTSFALLTMCVKVCIISKIDVLYGNL